MAQHIVIVHTTIYRIDQQMTEMEKCTTYRRRGDKCTISCKLGLWSVEGPYGLWLINEADHYFQQYKSDGEYDEILGVTNTTG